MRRSKKYSRPVRPLNENAALGGVHFEEGSGGTQYKVHHIQSGKKEYVCPGCGGIVAIGESHEVAWTEDTIWGAQYGQESRRHWHTSCWKHRGRR
ncbi:ATP/GTP-binding protein [Ancrocorticia populi]|uniref:ATP/GTP-binding protein n=1 Tax=Ancrocorticia populi TaxID=2175228 RepID=A0A2V1K407_9ACTO|nr:ATP/GTP-binding protein [Ancrocorticia populi]MDN6486016.1 ATP/GTP-binding protein [Ancrocorticia sp.]PWF24379.1 ATP/GTP-binding protein [Ancrocorticia populi]